MTKRSLEEDQSPDKRSRGNELDKADQKPDEDAEWAAFQALIGENGKAQDHVKESTITAQETVTSIELDIKNLADEEDEDAEQALATAGWDSDEQRLETRMADQHERRAQLEAIRHARDAGGGAKTNSVNGCKLAKTVSSPADEQQDESDEEETERGWPGQKK